jgi:hypothetical protein
LLLKQLSGGWYSISIRPVVVGRQCRTWIKTLPNMAAKHFRKSGYVNEQVEQIAQISVRFVLVESS